MANPKPWVKWEIEVQDRLGLRSTISSGNTFYDPSDGVDTRDHTDSDFLLMVDAKCTESQSYRVQQKFMNQWVTKAQEAGFRFALPVRMNNGEDGSAGDITDFAVITFEDFLELVESYREKNDKKPKVKKRVFTEDDIQLLTKVAEAIKEPKVRSMFLTIVDKAEKA